MSWELAVMAASVASAGAQYMSASAESKAGIQASRLKAEQASKNKSLTQIRTLQEEKDRRKNFAMLEAVNSNSVNYDPFSSPSFFAQKKEGLDNLNADVASIQLMGRIQAENYESEKQSANIEGDMFRSMGRTAWLKPAGTLLMGANKAYNVS